MAPIITLTTDFGLKDPYVAQLKAVLLSMAPEVEVVDITHQIEPQDIVEAAFVIETSWRYFPERTIHVVVVDPGVGGARKRLLMVSNGHYFVGPDNGVLSAALPPNLRHGSGGNLAYRPFAAGLPDEFEAYTIERLERMPRPPIATFEGRDVFSPAAALLATGTPPSEFGPRLHDVQALQLFKAPMHAGEVFGRVLRIDNFGNLITDISAADAYPGSRVRVLGRDLPLVRTYGDSGGLVALIGSQGYLEVALPNGSAARELEATRGTAVVCITHALER